jgi:hypothetical protein
MLARDFEIKLEPTSLTPGFSPVTAGLTSAS